MIGSDNVKTIKVFSDFACPFCYIGLSIADKLRKENPDVHFEYYPYELEPDAPAEGYDFSDEYPMDQIEVSYKRINRLGSEYGLVYNNKVKKSNTHRLHKASLYAKKEDKFFEFGKEAFKAIFDDSKNLADPKIINDIGLAAGLNIVEMNRCIDEGNFDEFMEEAKNLESVYNIESVPTFILEDGTQVTTLKEYEKFKKDLIGE